ncbi:DNA-3-methyladenine glycosylase I [Legionella septentrionalis]|uniref:DNA-3-methyladenine glycosylase I n=1 Tax=Legionella septentrionalis TaxID=2498109 RepID=A0A433JIX3_9GAMM|nr:DNA-3-methyladenine glycosylase I [Legionella septentrionalis]RUQ85318.1 DNA-3-methyladenine glycosylase I [Legionella septentrionalis]RUR10946.1 DNA-3-methyladenine glycosylase I [Legionella septentrionalis]RUR15387.1 DNA-3-methyladenine glycosylase I [Legionella septentrionalis]
MEKPLKAIDRKRCDWVPLDKPDYVCYHDTEWGVPVHDDKRLFEMLILEGAQAGLSWYTILKRRAGYRAAFKDFDVVKVSEMSDAELESILNNADIIRNRLKVFSARKNARIFHSMQQEFGSFSAYLWAFVDGKPLINRYVSLQDVPTRTSISDAISKDLKKRGMSFVGSTIIYAYMQAVGMVDDHQTGCFKACPGK